MLRCSLRRLASRPGLYAPRMRSCTTTGTAERGEHVKIGSVSVPLGPACDALGGAALAKDAAAATFSELGFRLEVVVGGVAHVLALPELAGRIVPERCAAKVRPSSRRVVVSLVKREPRPWTKLTAV